MPILTAQPDLDSGCIVSPALEDEPFNSASMIVLAVHLGPPAPILAGVTSKEVSSRKQSTPQLVLSAAIQLEYPVQKSHKLFMGYDYRVHEVDAISVVHMIVLVVQLCMFLRTIFYILHLGCSFLNYFCLRHRLVAQSAQHRYFSLTTTIYARVILLG